MSQPRLAFLGLGLMGGGMARRDAGLRRGAAGAKVCA